MTDFAIRIEGLGKQYRLGEKASYKTVRDLLASFPRCLVAQHQPTAPAPSIWALKDINLDIRKGEILGIIGRNGSGKSTLLKVLSRITDPSEGRAIVHGRVGALLEVGTGFHPELTGRENIFVNGAILGMPRREIRRKFDAIVDFSGIEEFLDTPVKRYSSGMRIRLAFSVAAHLEPEILFVDEVLAVGDAAFQRKCLGRIGEVSQQGRTVLFVSHQMEAIMGLCNRGVWLDKGQVLFDGSAEAAVAKYIGHQQVTVESDLESRPDRKGDGPLRVKRIVIENAAGESVASMLVGLPATIKFQYDSGGSEVRNADIRVWLENLYGQRLCAMSTHLTGQQFTSLPEAGEIVCQMPRLPVAPGLYTLTYVIEAKGRTVDKMYGAVSFEVIAADFYGSGRTLEHAGSFLIDHCWSVK